MSLAACWPAPWGGRRSAASCPSAGSRTTASRREMATRRDVALRSGSGRSCRGLFDVGAPIDYTWFVTSGIVSLRTSEEAEAGRREIVCLYNEDGAATEHARRAEG